MRKKDRIFVAGHNGLVGSAVLRRLKQLKYTNIITAEKKKLNLLDQKKVFNFLKKNNIKSIIICAARVGGIKANNTYKGNFIYENLTIQNNMRCIIRNIIKIFLITITILFSLTINRSITIYK